MAILNKDVAMLYQLLQHIMLRIHQYRVNIIYAWPRLVHHRLAVSTRIMENRDKEIADMCVNMNALSISVNIPLCTSIEDIQSAIY